MVNITMACFMESGSAYMLTGPATGDSSKKDFMTDSGHMRGNNLKINTLASGRTTRNPGTVLSKWIKRKSIMVSSKTILAMDMVFSSMMLEMSMTANSIMIKEKEEECTNLNVSEKFMLEYGKMINNAGLFK